MEKDWRWFGRKDKITLPMLRQIGVEGIVTALHDMPIGEVWTVDRISELKDYIESYGLRWSVVESLPVSEVIKCAGPERDVLIENYCNSLTNLGKCGIRTVCYNFMPVIDWIRTDLEYPCPDGSSSLYFDMAEFAYFDIHILRREGAEADYSANILKRVDALASRFTPKDRERLIDTIIVKTQGFVNGNFADPGFDPVGLFREMLKPFAGISKNDLRNNLRYFLKAVMPVCEEYGINLCIHPDDPPMPVLGLPRIVTSAADIEWILKAVDNPHNGLTFCAGSLSSGAHNDLVSMARKFASRTRFVHLRSCDVLPGGNFVEASHTAGRAHLVELIRIFERQDPSLPMRVDHGRTMLGDAACGYNPGYSFHGRMLALGQVDGMIAAVRNEIENKLI
ncbi:MAG: mannonate dehydratase [Bacteroidales bacterium]|nr:mannonate dehydratase [Bacteroidales bacterium]